MAFHPHWYEWSAWLWPLLLNHLWQATICFGVAWGLAWALRKASAQFRSLLWAAVLMKFLLPSALLVAVIGRFGVDPAINVSAHPIVVAGGRTLSQITQPLPSREVATIPLLQTTQSLPPTIAHSEWYCLFSLLWLSGVVVLLVRWGQSRRRLLRMLCNANAPTPRAVELLNTLRQRLKLRRQVSLRIVSDAVEPGVWRIWKPVIFLPQRLFDQLSDEELEAVLLHELAHVVQRDNLYLLLQRLLCLVGWFHPLVWLLQRRWIAERELLCDEKVLRQGTRPELYVASLWKVAQFGFGWSSANVSAANGSNLKRRIAQILPGNAPPSKRGWFVVAAAVLFVVVLAASVPFARRSALLAQASAQQIHVLPGIYKNGDNEKTRAQLDQTPEIPILFENLPNVPLKITDARLQAAKYKMEIAPLRVHTSCTYRIILTLQNQTTRRIVGIAYEVASSPGSRGGLMEVSGRYFPSIDPYDSTVLGRTSTSYGDCRIIPEPPSQMTIRIAGVQFETEPHWGSFHSYTT
ncbi:MAG TPA: M56 family metallopeptidase, partial [Blastocatellia bacterium]|nr:M56 family metallopeptidase [Blastocatellia bacterium]